jgi:hypothetical protein
MAAHTYDHYLIHQATDWRSAAWSGVIAGVVFLVAEMLMVAVFEGQSPWGPPRMIAAMVMGQDVLPPPADFDFGIVMVSMLIHFPLAVVYGLLIGWIVHRLTSPLALVAGLVIGFVIYLINFYPIAAAMFPWFGMARGWVSAVAHMIFGLAAAGAYVALRRAK